VTHSHRFTYRSSAARITSDSDSPVYALCGEAAPCPSECEEPS
jgi:hypothetical protein